MSQEQQNDESLWEQFNLADGNPDPGGGILYSLKYPAEQIDLKREAVVRALKENGVNLRDHEKGITAAFPAHIEEGQVSKILLLLEELSVLNEATEFSEAGFDAKDLYELGGQFSTTMMQMAKKGEKLKAYDFIELGMGQAMQDLQMAQMQNKVFTGKRKRELKFFIGAQRSAMNFLNGKTILIG